MNLSRTMDELGLAGLLANLNGDCFAAISDNLPSTMPSTGSMVAWGVVAIAVLAIWEQIKYQVGRMGKDTNLPGKNMASLIIRIH